MSETICSLEEVVYAAFLRACKEQDLAVAEHLLRALEVMAQRSGDGDRLQRAYLTLAGKWPQRPLHS